MATKKQLFVISKIEKFIEEKFTGKTKQEAWIYTNKNLAKAQGISQSIRIELGKNKISNERDSIANRLICSQHLDDMLFNYTNTNNNLGNYNDTLQQAGEVRTCV